MSETADKAGAAIPAPQQEQLPELLGLDSLQIQESEDEEPKDALSFEEFFQEQISWEPITLFLEVGAFHAVKAPKSLEESVQNNAPMRKEPRQSVAPNRPSL